MPVGGLARMGKWAIGAIVALQRLSPAEQYFRWYHAQEVNASLFPKKSPGSPILNHVPRTDHPARNRYLTGVIGRTILDDRISLGAGISVADLRAIDGVDLLYDGSIRILQDGYSTDYRLGMMADLGRNSEVEFLWFQNHLDMIHDVYYPELSPITYQVWPGFPTDSNLKRNSDHTRTSGLHCGYSRPLRDDAWRIGGIVTINWKSHPKIPEYELQFLPAIPRDPGYSRAYNLGIGLSGAGRSSRFGIDFIFEPVWTDTWGVADQAMETRSGGVIQPGGKTVENFFTFLNAHLRLGLAIGDESGGLQFGLHIHSISYQLDQLDNSRERWRRQNESWIEWSPSLGAHLDIADFQVRYLGRLKLGTGIPKGWPEGAWWNPISLNGSLSISPSGPDFLVAPTGPYRFEKTLIATHQVALVIPFGR